MSQWKSKRGYGSDHVADILGGAMKEIRDLYLETEERPGVRKYNMLDLADAIEFCSMGIFIVEIHPEAEELVKKMEVRDLGSRLIETIPNRGQMHDDEDE